MTSLFSVLLLASPAFKGPPVKSPAAALATRVQRFYEHAKDFSARFGQTSTYPTFGNVKKASGKVLLKKPDLLRWEYDDGRLIVLDGRSLWNWNPEDKEVSVKRAFGIAQVPQEFAFLFGKGSLLDKFDARIPGQKPEGLPEGDALELVPRAPGAEVQKLVFVVAKDGQVLASVLTNAQGDTNQLVFSSVKVNARLPDTLFRFAPPKDAHVQEVQ